MTNEIISYLEMCQREGTSLQRGMNFGLGQDHSVILMSVRPNSPYNDRIEDDGTTLIYEGHDVPRKKNDPDPKSVDQRRETSSGKLTQNGKFYEAVTLFKRGKRNPEKVRVYEKIRQGIWSYNGLFSLVDAWREKSGARNVFKFKLIAVADEADKDSNAHSLDDRDRRRIIPTSVKVEVWKRDKGQCVVCGADDELHFDHIVPYSKGGTSLKAENVQLLCARHNLQKSDKIL